MKCSRFLLVFLLVVCLCMPAAAETADAKTKLEQAFSAKTLEEQAELVAQAAALSEGNAEMLMACAQVLLYFDSNLEESELCERILLQAYEAAESENLRGAILNSLVSFYAYSGNSDSAHRFLEDAAQTASDKIPYLNASATLHFYEGDTETAQALIAEVLSLDPENYSALLTRANIFSYCYDYPNAIEAFDALLELYPDSTDALHQQYTTLVSAGEFKKAARTIDKLISMTNNDAFWLSRAQLTLWQRYEPEAALKEAEALLKMNENWMEALTVKVGALLMLERYDEAISATDAYASVSTEQSSMMRALANMDSGRYEESIALWDTLLSGQTVLPIYYTYRAAAQYYAYDDAVSALSYLADAVQLGADDSSFYLNLGHMYRRLGRYEQAALSYWEAADSTYDDPTAEYFLVLVFAEAGKTEGMLSALETMETHYPGWYETLLMRVIVEDLLGHADAALETFTVLEEKFPYPAQDLWSMKAVLLSCAGEKDAALEILSNPENMEKADCADWCNRGLALLYLEDYEGAETALAEALNRLGTDSSADTRIDRVNLETALALLSLRTGDLDGCASHLETAAQSGWQPAQLVHWKGFESFVETEAFADLLDQYDTASASWNFNKSIELPRKN